MLHRLTGNDVCPSPLKSQNPKSNQVTRVLREMPGSIMLGQGDGRNCKNDSVLLKNTFFFLNQLLILSKIKFRAQKLKDFLQFKKFKVDFLL